MTPPIKMLENTEVFDAFDEADRQVLRISAPGRGVLTVTDDGSERDVSETYTEEELEQIREGMEAANRGDYQDAYEVLAEIQAAYGL